MKKISTTCAEVVSLTSLALLDPFSNTYLIDKHFESVDHIETKKEQKHKKKTLPI